MHAVVDLRLTQSAVRLGAVDNPPQRAAARVRRTHLPYRIFVVRDGLDASKGNRRSVECQTSNYLSSAGGQRMAILTPGEFKRLPSGMTRDASFERLDPKY